jgi:tetratricopeptide (TPR) repeat protein
VAHDRGEAGRADILERAAETLRAAGDEVRAADLDQLQAEAWWLAGDQDRCRAYLDSAWRQVASAPPSLVKARVLAQLVRFDVVAARYDAERVREAVAISQALGLEELRAHVLISAGSVRLARGDDAGIDQIAEGAEAARAGNWLHALNRSATNLGTHLACRGRAREALEQRRQAMEIAERMGSWAQWRLARGNLIEGWAECGEWALAGPAAEEFLAESERLGAHYMDVPVACVRAMLRLGGGDLDGALADQAFALGRARAAKDPQVVYYALAVAAHVLADTGRLEEARERFDELVGLDPQAFWFLEFVVGDVTWAATVIDRVEPARRALAGADWPSLQAGRAFLDGDAVTAAAIHDIHGGVRSAALCRLHGATPEGLEDALAFFAAAGATRYAEQARRLLAERGAEAV